MHSTRPEHQPLTTLHLDRGYDYGAVKTTAVNHGIDDVVCAKRRKRGAAAAKTTVPLGLRWAIERTNSWLSNFGQLRRNTDRRPRHRLAQLALAIALLLTANIKQLTTPHVANPLKFVLSVLASMLANHPHRPTYRWTQAKSGTDKTSG